MRTDLVLVCRPCRLRVAADRAVCPRCDAAGLTAAGADGVAGTRPRRLAWAGSALFTAIVFTAVAAIAIGELFAWDRFVRGEHGGKLWFFVPLSLLVGFALGVFGVALLWIAVWPLLDRLLRRLEAPAPARLGVERVVAPAREIAAAGTARAVPGPGLIAPLSGRPCLAFRLVGHVDGHDVDDGAAVDLVVETDDGRSVLVRPAPAIVALEPDGRGESPGPEAIARLAAFLAPRGIRGPTAIALAEAVLAPGDGVEVGGTVVEEPDPTASHGFRDAGRRPVVRALSGEPVVLRPRG